MFSMIEVNTHTQSNSMESQVKIDSIIRVVLIILIISVHNMVISFIPILRPVSKSPLSRASRSPLVASTEGFDSHSRVVETEFADAEFEDVAH